MDEQLTQVALIGWTDVSRLQVAEGACERVLGHRGDVLIGMPLHEALSISKARAIELHEAAHRDGLRTEFVTRSRGAVLRLVLEARDGGIRAAVLDLTDILTGAPPVQISRLSSSLSHEIRNPLSSVKMAVQTVARNASLSERDQRRLAIANREIRTMERMLWLLSEYGRDSSAALESAAIRTLIQEAASLIEPELAERKISLEVSESSTEPLRARADLSRLRPVLAQLILNVAMGSPEAGAVRMAVRRDGAGNTELVVEDPFGAVPSEEEKTLFEPFGSRLARGAGLSLAALQRAMQSQGGSISVSTHPQTGMTFTLTFPG